MAGFAELPTMDGMRLVFYNRKMGEETEILTEILLGQPRHASF